MADTECDICFTTFATKQSLALHKLIHTLIKVLEALYIVCLLALNVYFSYSCDLCTESNNCKGNFS